MHQGLLPFLSFLLKEENLFTKNCLHSGIRKSKRTKLKSIIFCQIAIYIATLLRYKHTFRFSNLVSFSPILPFFFNSNLLILLG